MQSLWESVGGRVVQIHSSKRADRAQLIRIWTQEHGVRPAHFEAIMRTPGFEGCLLSHSGVASQMSAPYLVLEDDALPTAAVHNVQAMFHVLEAIKSGEFDILYLGGLPAAGRVTPTQFPGIVEGRCLATYAMVVSEAAAQKLRKLKWRGTPVDVELVQDLSLRTAFVHPPLFIMADTHSDIGNSAFTRSKAFSTLLSRVAPVWRFAIVYQRELAFALFVLVVAVVVLVWKQNGNWRTSSRRS